MRPKLEQAVFMDGKGKPLNKHMELGELAKTQFPNPEESEDCFQVIVFGDDYGVTNDLSFINTIWKKYDDDIGMKPSDSLIRQREIWTPDEDQRGQFLSEGKVWRRHNPDFSAEFRSRLAIDELFSIYTL